MGVGVGDGSRVLFWEDGRMCVGSLLILFPRVFTVVSNKEAFVKEYYVMEGTRVVWSVSCRRRLCWFEESKYKSLLSFLMFCVQRQR